MQVAVENNTGNEQYCKTDSTVKQRGTHVYDRQDFQREHDFLHVVDIGQYQSGCAVDHFGKQAMDDHADKQHHGKLGFGFFSTDTPPGFEYHGEDEGVHTEHQHRIEERPRQTHHGTAVTTYHLAFCQLGDERAMPPQAAGQCGGRRGVTGVGIHADSNRNTSGTSNGISMACLAIAA